MLPAMLSATTLRVRSLTCSALTSRSPVSRRSTLRLLLQSWQSLLPSPAATVRSRSASASQPAFSRSTSSEPKPRKLGNPSPNQKQSQRARARSPSQKQSQRARARRPSPHHSLAVFIGFCVTNTRLTSCHLSSAFKKESLGGNFHTRCRRSDPMASRSRCSLPRRPSSSKVLRCLMAVLLLLGDRTETRRRLSAPSRKQCRFDLGLEVFASSGSTLVWLIGMRKTPLRDVPSFMNSRFSNLHLK